VPAGKRLLTDPRGLPVGDMIVRGTDDDFLATRTIGRTQLDTAFTSLTRDADGRVGAWIEGPDDRRVTLWADPAFDYLMVYTGDTLQPVERRRRAVAIEPMTCPPNALATGVGVIRLEPDASWTGRWGISPQSSASSTSATAVT
jgi:aldose 1-epimerase